MVILDAHPIFFTGDSVPGLSIIKGPCDFGSHSWILQDRGRAPLLAKVVTRLIMVYPGLSLDNRGHKPNYLGVRHNMFTAVHLRLHSGRGEEK